jgi:hypothetical protein
MTFLRWEDVDHDLVSLRLSRLVEEMQCQIEKDEQRIQSENRTNMNSMAVPSLVLKMKEERADDLARRVYEMYCDVWQKQGHQKSPGFLRTVFSRGVRPILRARAGAIAAEFSRFAVAASFSPVVCDAILENLRLNMQRLEDRWLRCIEIEAKECEHALMRVARHPRVTVGDPSAPRDSADVSANALANERADTHTAQKEPSTNQRSSLAERGSSDAEVVTWEAIKILFLSDERIQIHAGPSIETRNYGEFGFIDARSGKPRHAWVLLRALAEHRGVIRNGMDASQEWPKVEKRIQEIRKVLRKHFGISADPIPFVEGVGYQARFNIGCGPSYET